MSQTFSRLHMETNRHPNTDGTPWGAVCSRPHPALGAGSGPTGVRITWTGVEGRANAGFIVRAVNSHDALLSAAKAELEWIEHGHAELQAAIRDWNASEGGTEEAARGSALERKRNAQIDALRAAIALAEGGAS